MARRQRKDDLAAIAVAPQLKKYAFTVNGHVMEEGMPDRKPVEIICAYDKGGNYKKIITKTQEDVDREGSGVKLFRSDLTYTDRELADPEAGLRQYLVIGYARRQLEPDITGKATYVGKTDPVGVALPENKDEIEKWNDEAPPLLVVTEILQEKPDGIQLWCLMMQKHGLCVPYSIAQKQVFYRCEFRVNSPQLKDRCTKWNELVAMQSVRPGIDTAPKTAKEEKFKRGKNVAKLVFDPNVSLGNEIASLADAYVVTKNVWFIDEIKAVLKTVNTDLEFRPLPNNRGLRNFVEASEELTPDQAAEVVKDMEEMWPTVENVTKEHVLTLKRSLLLADIELEYRFIRPFLAAACEELAQDPAGYQSNEERVRKLVEKTCKTARLMLGEPEETPPLRAGQSDQLGLLAGKLREMKLAAETFDVKIRESYGETPLSDGSPSVLWSRYADASDTDTARAAFLAQVKMLGAAFRQKERGLSGMADDLIQVIEKITQ